MAHANAFKLNKAAIEEGEWIEIGPEEARFEVRVRGATAAWRDGLAWLRADAARKYNRKARSGMTVTPSQLPPSLDDQCMGQALADLAVLGVRGFYHSDRTDVTIEEFKEMLRDAESWGMLVQHVMEAVFRLQVQHTGEIETATKN